MAVAGALLEPIAAAPTRAPQVDDGADAEAGSTGNLVRGGLGRALNGDERRALLLGPEWISLELAARFAADALRENYFGWDPTRFPSRGAHNLVRARGQWALHEAFVGTHAQRARLLGA